MLSVIWVSAAHHHHLPTCSVPVPEEHAAGSPSTQHQAAVLQQNRPPTSESWLVPGNTTVPVAHHVPARTRTKGNPKVRDLESDSDRSLPASPLPCQAPPCLKPLRRAGLCRESWAGQRGAMQGTSAHALLQSLAGTVTDKDEIKLAGAFQNQSLEQDSSSFTWTPEISPGKQASLQQKGHQTNLKARTADGALGHHRALFHSTF